MSVTESDDTRLDALEREIERYKISRDAWTLVVLALGGLAALAGFIAAAIALSNDDGGGGGGGGVATASAESVSANLSEFAIDLSTSSVSTPGTVTVRNTGTMLHNIAVRGEDLVSGDVEAGQTTELDISSLAPGTYEFYCTVPGHAESGMTAEFTVGGEGAASGAAESAADGTATAHDHEMTAEEGAQQDQAMIDSIMAFPAATEGLGNQPLAPEVLPDGTKRFELTASIVDWEVRPGEVVQAWAYNGTVPGPRIDLEVGDHVQVQLTNELPIGTDIHWHGVDVPNDQDGVAPITQDLIKSGETYTYEFTVTEPAIAMYHAHAHSHEAVPNGLFGTLYVGDVPLPAGQTISGIEIPADITIAQDLPMVLNDAGVIGLSLDGKSFPATTPIVAKLGDWIRLTYYNEGLQVHPMHLHGFEQIVIAKDGEPLDHPYAADTQLVAPGERYTVLFHADSPGTWVLHCHILNHVESAAGMFGMVTAVVVQ